MMVSRSNIQPLAARLRETLRTPLTGPAHESELGHKVRMRGLISLATAQATAALLNAWDRPLDLDAPDIDAEATRGLELIEREGIVPVGSRDTFARIQAPATVPVADAGEELAWARAFLGLVAGRVNERVPGTFTDEDLSEIDNWGTSW